jgi:hypothetical protein
MPQNKLKRDAYLGSNDQLPGLPGYRTREGRSGYDPLDTNREVAFMEGTFYRKLFTLQLRTRNAFYLALMLIFGVAVSGFMSIALYAIITMPKYGARTLGFYLLLGGLYLVLGFICLVGWALLVNFVINLGAILGIGANRLEPKSKKESISKKLPKRRKDYR